MKVYPLTLQPSYYSRQAQNALRIIIDHIWNTNRRHHLQQIRRDALEQTSIPLTLDGLHSHIHNSRVCRRMYRSALALQSCSQQIDGINSACTKGSAESADACSGEVRRRRGWRRWVTVLYGGVSVHEVLLAVFECGEVDGGVREHADKAHWEATVEGTDARRSPHFGGGFGD